MPDDTAVVDRLPVLDGRVVGMARLVGDDVTYFSVQDLAVLPLPRQ